MQPTFEIFAVQEQFEELVRIVERKGMIFESGQSTKVNDLVGMRLKFRYSYPDWCVAEREEMYSIIDEAISCYNTRMKGDTENILSTFDEIMEHLRQSKADTADENT